MADTPKIRFKGFVDAWEQRKLGEVFEEYVEKNHPELPALTIIQGGGTVRRDESDRNIMYDKASLTGYKLVRKDDFILHLRSFEGGLEKATCDGIISPAYHTFHGVSADARFYYAFFRSYEFIKKKLVPHIYGIRDGKSIDVEGMKSVEIPYPSFEEQKRIGDYIEALDHLITFHQHKCDETKELKRYMLQKMFPRNGKKNPEIRFAGFTDAWEQCKFGDCNELITGYPFESEKFAEQGIKLVRGMNVKRGYLDFADEICMRWSSSEGLENFLLESNDILIQMDGALIGKSYAKIEESQLPALLVQRVTRARTKRKIADSNFMYQTIQRDFLNYIAMNKTETAVPHLSLNDIREFKIDVPSLEEQQRIGCYFEALDHLITLHQRKCDELKEVKKFMLQNMFPQKG